MTAAIVVFTVYQAFYGLLSFYYSNAMQKHPEDLSEMECKLWRENTALSAGATLFVLAARITGVAWLVWFGIRTEWYYPALLFVVTLLGTVVINGFIRASFGVAVPALLGFVVLPASGTALWFLA